MSFDRANPPTLLISIPLEGWPRLRFQNIRDDDDRLRLRAWLEYNEPIADLVNRALELAREKRAA